METYRKINQWKSHSRDMIESIKRFYSNSFVDGQRQDAINLFLGHYVWKEGRPNLWEMNTDFYLHNNDLKGSRRSYTHWWNNYHIKSLREILQKEIIDQGNDVTYENTVRNVRGYPDAFDNYWNEYYLPRSITYMQDLFAYNMNSTRRYHNEKKYGPETSPFTSRKQTSINNKLKSILLDIDNKNSSPKLESSSLDGKVNANDELELSENNLNHIIDSSKSIKDSLDSYSNSVIPIFSRDRGFSNLIGLEADSNSLDLTDEKVSWTLSHVMNSCGNISNSNYFSPDTSFYKKSIQVDDYKSNYNNRSHKESENIVISKQNLQLYEATIKFPDAELLIF